MVSHTFVNVSPPPLEILLISCGKLLASLFPEQINQIKTGLEEICYGVYSDDTKGYNIPNDAFIPIYLNRVINLTTNKIRAVLIFFRQKTSSSGYENLLIDSDFANNEEKQFANYCVRFSFQQGQMSPTIYLKTIESYYSSKLRFIFFGPLL